MKAYLEIEMPACINCRFCKAGDSTSYCLAQSHELERGGWYMHHIKWDKGIGYEAQKTWREKTCPLIPVPPHGALIDRDDLFAECTELVNGYKTITDYLVVIPAEPPKDDSPAGTYDLLYEEGGPDA